MPSRGGEGGLAYERPGPSMASVKRQLPQDRWVGSPSLHGACPRIGLAGAPQAGAAGSMAVTVRESGRGWSGRVGVMTAWIWSTVSAATGRAVRGPRSIRSPSRNMVRYRPVRVGRHVAGAVHRGGEGDLQEDGVGAFEVPADAGAAAALSDAMRRLRRIWVCDCRASAQSGCSLRATVSAPARRGRAETGPEGRAP